MKKRTPCKQKQPSVQEHPQVGGKTLPNLMQMATLSNSIGINHKITFKVYKKIDKTQFPLNFYVFFINLVI